MANFLDTLYARQQQLQDRGIQRDQEALQALPGRAAEIVVGQQAADQQRAQVMGQTGMEPDYR